MICCPGASVYSTAEPSISRNAMPWPESFCMMKPSPPKKPAPTFFWKWMERSTPGVAARNALFCAITGIFGVISTARIAPGKLEAKAIMPGPPSAV